VRPYSRRKFLGSAALGAAAIAATSPLGAKDGGRAAPAPQAGGKFKLKYAPSLGMFSESAGKDPLGQIKFVAGQGFRAVFDNGLMGRLPQEQEAIARELARLGLDLGPFVAYADFSVKSFVTRDASVRQMLEGRLKTAVECAKRTGAKQTLVVPGRYDERLEWDYQTANVVENLKWAAGIVEPAGLTIVIEPLNPHDHPGLFLSKMPQAYQICQAVRSPSCKIIEDIYHQQISEGNIIPNIDGCYDEIAAFHCGDTPGRNEPGTGELNYRMIFKHLYEKKYDGVVCMEHGKSRRGLEGEKAVIEAYRACDNF
jgi:hydroxypyruvate isomerase